MYKPIENTKSAQWHLAKFKEFIRYKECAGEPSPHLRTVVHMSKDLGWEERVWRVGCYAASYSVLSGEILWHYWPYKKAKATSALIKWLEKHWGHFHIRTERRCVRSLKNFTKCLLGYRQWIANDLKPALDASQNQGTREFYEHMWDVVNRVPYFGRYIVIRAIESLRRLDVADARLFDIRAIGGHSPVRCMTLFFPKKEKELLSGNVDTVMQCGENLVQKVSKTVPHVNHYVCAAMLCEYRKAFEDGHEYAARTQDAEIGHYNKFVPYWSQFGFESEIPLARAQIFDHRCLGEIQGWDNVRRPLEKCLKQYGYNWSDTVYDYNLTQDFSCPVKRS